MATRHQDTHQHPRRRQSQHHRPSSVAATTKSTKRPRSMRYPESNNSETTTTTTAPCETDIARETTTTAMLLLWEPHVAFGISALAFKFFFPSLLKWLAYDNIVTLIVSVWIPLVYTVTVIHQNKQQQQQEPKLSSNGELRFWLRYWSLGFAVAQFVNRLMQLTPLLYQAGLQYPHIPVLLAEIQFIFFAWIFALNRTVLTAYRRYRYALNLYWRHRDDCADQEEQWPADDSEPLSLMDNLVRPHLLQLQAFISEPISKETWQWYIHSKAQRILDLLVVLQFLTEEWREYLLLLLDEGRSLVVISIFLVLPSSLTQIGIVYAKYVLPSARSCSITTAGGSGEDELLHLQYWVLNVILSSFLAGGSWLYWFLPFSTQIIFATWCYFTFPRTIREYYAVLEMELIAFGLLSGESELALQETKTVKVLRALAKRIPSANDAEGFRWADSEDESDNDEQERDNDDSASVASHRQQQRKAKMKVRRALGSRTKSSPSALKTFTPSARQQLVNEQQQEEEENDIDDEDGHTQNGFGQRRATEQVLPPSLSGIEESDDSSVAAVCNVDVSSSHDSSDGGPTNLRSGAHFLESISSYQDQSVITTTRSAASDDAMVVNSPLSRITLSSPSTHSAADSDGSSRHGYARDVYFSDMDTGSSAENLEIAPSFESHFDGGHYFDGSIRDLRRSLNGGGTSPIQQATRRSERVRQQQRSQLQQQQQKPQVHPGYLQPTESSRRSRRVRREEYENESSTLLHEVLSFSRRLRQTSRCVRENDKMDDDLDDYGYEPMVGRIQSPGESSTSGSSPGKVRQRRPCRNNDKL